MAALVLLLTAGPATARTLDQMPHYLKKEGNFVAYPATAVSGLGALVGGVVALPAAVIAAPIGWMAGDTLGYTMLPISLLAAGGAEAGYHVGGAIPWAIKNSLYDAPMAGIAKIKGEPASGLVAQVDPPPALAPVDLQYLASTPPEARIPVVPPRDYSWALPPPKELTSLMLKRALSPFKLPPGTPGVAPAYMAAPKANLARQTPLSPATAPKLSVPASAPLTGGGTAADATPRIAPSVQTPPPAAVTPPPVRAAVRTAEKPSAPAAPVEAAPRPAPDADTTVPEDDAVEVERPSLHKKKKFSERFGF